MKTETQIRIEVLEDLRRLIRHVESVEVTSELVRIVEQRDELLAALVEIIDAHNGDYLGHGHMDAARAAIAKVKGEHASAALKEAERLKVLANELFMECWHRHHVSGVGPV